MIWRKSLFQSLIHEALLPVTADVTILASVLTFPYFWDNLYSTDYFNSSALIPNGPQLVKKYKINPSINCFTFSTLSSPLFIPVWLLVTQSPNFLIYIFCATLPPTTLGVGNQLGITCMSFLCFPCGHTFHWFCRLTGSCLPDRFQLYSLLSLVLSGVINKHY